MNNQQQQDLENQIRASVGSAPAANFDAWEQQHGEALDSLMSAQSTQAATSLPQSRSQHWAFALAVASVVLMSIAISSVLFPRNHAFAKTIEAINLAKTMTWVRTAYRRGTSEDKNRQWLVKKKVKATYMEPGFYRYDSFDENGELTSTTIFDPIKNQRLSLYHTSKVFELADRDVNQVAYRKEMSARTKNLKNAKLNVGPFAWFNRAITEGGEIVGQRMVDGRKVNVLRWHNLAMGIHNPKNVSDVWIDAETEQIVGTSHPGSSVFDPEQLDYRNNPAEEKFSSMKILGSISKEIVLDPKVDPAIFEFNIPDDFSEAVQRETRPVTEDEMIEWLELLAVINDNQFVDGFVIRNTKKIAESSQSDNPSELEKERRSLWGQHERNGNTSPLWDFIEANTYIEDCKYLGKDVALGAAEIPILIYRMKSTGKYRVVYGDMRVEDISDLEAEQIKNETQR